MQTKRIFFEELDKTHADLVVKLRSRGITQKDFFQYIVRAFVDDDVLLQGFFDNLIEQRSHFGKKVKKRVQRTTREGRGVQESFGLTEKEKSEIFDILEAENFDI